MSTTTHLITADELMRLPDNGRRYELIKGELLTMSPASGKHGAIAMRLSRILANYIEERELGLTFTAETGFKLERDPDTVLAPDFAFISRERMSTPPDEFVMMAPDLVVEVGSPSQSNREIKLKAERWIKLGAKLVWVVQPKTRIVQVYRKSHLESFTEGQTLECEDVLPGLRISLAYLFKF
ncbi:MAG TPA: Uma2 family endonuclease [Pyrinomonadaceae bacterium]